MASKNKTNAFDMHKNRDLSSKALKKKMARLVAIFAAIETFDIVRGIEHGTEQ